MRGSEEHVLLFLFAFRTSPFLVPCSHATPLARTWLGGGDGSKALNTIERWDVGDSAFTASVDALATHRANATATVWRGNVYLAGGFYISEGGPLGSWTLTLNCLPHDM